MNIVIKKTNDALGAFKIAQGLQDFFDTAGLKQIEEETKLHILYGAYDDEELVGFATYKEINSDTIEMSWLGVLHGKQRSGVGTTLVKESLKDFAKKYKVCEVKTLSEDDPYEPYKKTRAFYKKIGFIPIETINPYPGWEDNPCQIFVKFLN